MSKSSNSEKDICIMKSFTDEFYKEDPTPEEEMSQKIMDDVYNSCEFISTPYPIDKQEKAVLECIKRALKINKQKIH